MAVLRPVENPSELDGLRRIEVFNPATLERTGEICLATTQDVRDAVARARVAQPAWAQLSFGQRARHVLAVREVLLERMDEIVDTVCADTGKPRVEAIGTEVMAAADVLTYYARNAHKLLASHRKPLRRMRQKKLLVSYRPMGVVGIITTWNFPFILSIHPTAQALMAGNAVVLKPSEVTPLVGIKLGEIFSQAGFPEGVFQVVTGDGSAGAALTEAGCDKISFTGSARTGSEVAVSCGRQLLPLTLELSGKDPMIVCGDADVDRAAKGAVWGAFSNSGQLSMSTERVYVVEKVAKRFIEKVVELTGELRQGPECDGEIDVGSLTFAPLIEVIDAQVKDAVAKGARVLTGGQRNPLYDGYFYEPTVLVDVDHSMEIMREETLGPTLPIMVVADEDEAIRLANDSAYDLQASIWSRDGYRARTLGARINARGITVDDSLVAYGLAESPFGGMGGSGIGWLSGEIGIKSYCHMQSVILPRFRVGRQSLRYPYHSGTIKQLQRLQKLLYRSPLAKLFGG
jgi:acyl-CoA reductase-like NAD-dependent aldehyde dehydrogenase